MKFRMLKEDDAREVFLLGKPVFGKKSEYSWDWSEKKVREFAHRPFGAGMVCEEENKIAGFALVQLAYSSQKPNVCWLSYIFVKPHERHEHMGTKLVEHLIEKLEKFGKKDVIVDVYANNKGSLSFFKADKFKIKEKWVTLSRKI